MLREAKGDVVRLHAVPAEKSHATLEHKGHGRHSVRAPGSRPRLRAKWLAFCMLQVVGDIIIHEVQERLNTSRDCFLVTFF